MKKSLQICLAAGLVAFFPMTASADQAADAQSLAEKAAAHLSKVGEAQACKDFADKGAGYIQEDLYVVVQDMSDEIKVVCHPINAKLNGKKMVGLKDPGGKFFAKEMLQQVKKSQSGWVDYQWIHPATKKVAAKRGYVLGVEGKYFLTVGYYK